ncbi:hypothetical protein GUJ93_ZPchr0001g29257 [Zizania palustris]|uniref:Rapid alkalinization factor-like n=1 Tax=Zizania palustris TaxID=103762 RepID=A0A8J5S2W7_ZIZPA|nr:hypothetical protein GUJ93_ZPchr0001g29257 [Zizania palustris]
MVPPPLSRAVLAVVAASAVLLAVAAVQDQYSWPAAGVGEAAVSPYCEGTAEECAAGGVARRQLGNGGGYISYDAMRRNSVPCSYRGASYYNCHPGGQANPYYRGCSAITQCRG